MVARRAVALMAFVVLAGCAQPDSGPPEEVVPVQVEGSTGNLTATPIPSANVTIVSPSPQSLLLSDCEISETIYQVPPEGVNSQLPPGYTAFEYNGLTSLLVDWTSCGTLEGKPVPGAYLSVLATVTGPDGNVTQFALEFVTTAEWTGQPAFTRLGTATAQFSSSLGPLSSTTSCEGNGRKYEILGIGPRQQTASSSHSDNLVAFLFGPEARPANVTFDAGILTDVQTTSGTFEGGALGTASMGAPLNGYAGFAIGSLTIQVP